MANKDITELSKNVNYLALYIKENTRREKAKHVLREEYKRGNFIDVPPEYVQEEPKFVEELISILNLNQDKIVKIPKGIVGSSFFTDVNVLSIVINSLARNVKAEFLYSKKSLEDIYGTLKELGFNEDFFKRFNELSPKEKYALLKNEYNEKFNIFMNFDYREVINLSKQEEVHENFNSDEKICEYREKLYEQDFNQIELDYRGYINSGMIEFLNQRCSFFREDSIVSDDIRAKEDLNNQKEYLKITIEQLDQIGVLDDLIKYENENIKVINRFLKSKIKVLSKENLYKFIDELDLNKPEDVIKLSIMGRNFSNKLTKNYKVFALAAIYMNTVDDTEFDIKRNEQDNRIEQEINETSSRIINLYIEAKKKYEDEKEKERIKLEHERDEKIQRLRREGNDVEAERLSAGKIRPTISDYSFADDFINEYKQYTNSKKNASLNLLQRPYSIECETIIKDAVEIVIREREKERKIEDKLEYCGNIYEELTLLQKAYRDLEYKTNGIVKRESFSNLVARIINNSRAINEYSELNTIIAGEKDNIGKRLEKLIERVSNEGIICNSDKVLLSVSQKIELIQQIYTTKHLFTRSLVNASKKYPNIIRCENKPVIESVNKSGETVFTNGVVDIYMRGAIQVFGGHYKSYEPEADDYNVQSLPEVDARIDKAFEEKNSKTQDSYLATYIPILDLNQEQQSEFEELRSIMDRVENGEISGKGKSKRARGLLDLKEKDRELYDALKLRLDLSIEEKKFEGNSEVHLTNQEALAVRTAIQMLSQGSSLADLKNIFSKNVLDYIVRETENNTRSCEVDRVLNETFGDDISEEQMNQERKLFFNKINEIEDTRQLK